MRLITAPDHYEAPDQNLKLFLAGGITDCPDWQAELCNKLKDLDITIFNPRRQNKNFEQKEESIKQIKWEFHHLNLSDLISFWFPAETLCPITLLELGARLRTSQDLIIGTHPNYKRSLDVEVQTSLIYPNLKIAKSLSELEQQIREKIVFIKKSNFKI